MAGLVPQRLGYAESLLHPRLSFGDVVKTWMPGTRPGMTEKVVTSVFFEVRPEHGIEAKAITQRM